MPRVLIAEDRASDRKYLQVLLESAGYEVTAVGDGREALEAAASVQPDLIISDILMPSLDGYQFVMELRRLPALADTPVIFYTATYHESEARELAVRCGVTAVLVKPSSPATILARIADILEEPTSTTVVDISPGDFEEAHRKLLSSTLVETTDDLETSRQRLAALLDFSARLATERDPSALLRLVGETAREVALAQHVVVGLINDAGTAVDGLVTVGLDPRGRRQLSPPSLDGPLLRELVTARRTVRLINAGGAPAAIGLPADHPPVHAYLGVPLASSERLYGWVDLRNKVGGSSFSAIDERLVSVMCLQAGIAYENARLYADLLRRTMDLEEQVRERKSVEAQLQLAQKLEVIGQMAGGLAHDFNNHLTTIIGYANLVDSTLEDGDARRADLQEVRRAAVRAADLTHQLLAVSRRQVVQPVDLDVHDALQQMSQWLRRLIGEHIELRLQLDAAPQHVRIDPGQFEQIVMNLAVNARDAMPTGGLLSIETSVVTLEADQAVADVRGGSHVRLVVRDTGSGMTAEIRSRVFEPFFTTKPTGKGSGLGLATVYGIVRQNRGRIAVESAPGRGTLFSIALPAGRAVPRKAEPAAAETEPPGGSETVLVVEDQPAIRYLLRNSLERAGYRVVEAPSPMAAVTLATNEPPDILVSDVLMPGMTGLELYQQIKASQPGLRVLFVSGYVNEDVSAQVEDDSDAGLLAKPFMAEDLLRRVRELLDR